MPYRRGALFEGMLPPGEAAAVEAAKNAIPGIAIAAARAVAGEERDCPCAVSMERYRKRGVIGPDFRGWVSRIERGGALRFTDDLVRRLCAAILARWKAKGLIHPKASDEALLSRMTAEIHKDIQREAELDRDADALLQKHMEKLEGSQANSRILFQKIKERLAKERDIVL